MYGDFVKSCDFAVHFIELIALYRAGGASRRPYGVDGRFASIAVILRSFATKNPVPFAANHGVLR